MFTATPRLHRGWPKQSSQMVRSLNQYYGVSSKGWGRSRAARKWRPQEVYTSTRFFPKQLHAACPVIFINFTCCLIWMSNLLFHIKGRTQSVGDWGQGAEHLQLTGRKWPDIGDHFMRSFTICTFHQILRRKSKGKRPLEELGVHWKYIIKTDVKEIG
jgi:hypothetical protein